MLDLRHLARTGRFDVQVFCATNGSIVGPVWNKPRGVSGVYILAVGAGGNGGNGAVGANSAAAGGGGGASGGQTQAVFAANMLPDTLYVTAQWASSAIVRTGPAYSVQDVLVYANSGSNGNNASGATAGTGAFSSGASTIGNFSLAGAGLFRAFGTGAGATGGSSATYPTTGIRVCGGAGGAALGAAGAVGVQGGSIPTSGIGQPGLAGGAGGSSATVPPGGGSSGAGILVFDRAFNLHGGAGGGSTHGSATGAGLVGANGGNGDPGCGGGGGGGALTGSTQGLGGRGGPGFVVILSW